MGPRLLLKMSKAWWNRKDPMDGDEPSLFKIILWAIIAMLVGLAAALSFSGCDIATVQTIATAPAAVVSGIQDAEPDAYESYHPSPTPAR